MDPKTTAIAQKKRGRPLSLQPDDETLRRCKEYAAHMFTQREAAAAFGVDHNTFDAFLGRNKIAREAWDMGKELGKASIRRQQFVHAKRHAGMSIWLGKIYLEQREVSQTQMGGIPGQPPVGIEHSTERGLTALLEAARRNAESAKKDK